MRSNKVMGKQKSCDYKSFIDRPRGNMVSKGGSANQEPGQTGTTRGSPSKFGVSGGSGHMAGKQSVKAAKAL